MLGFLGDVQATVHANAAATTTSNACARYAPTTIGSEQVPSVSTSVRGWVLAVALVASFGIRSCHRARTDSAAFSEPEYITAGYSYLATRELRLERLLLFLSARVRRRRRGGARALRPGVRRPHALAWHLAQSRVVARRFLYAPDNDAAAITAHRAPRSWCSGY